MRPPSSVPAALLAPEDVACASNATRTVDCAERHTAETYAVGDLPDDLRRRRRRRPEVAAWAYRTCSTKLAGVPRRRREPGDAQRRELGVVPALAEGVGPGRAVVPLRRRRRRRAEPLPGRAADDGARAAGTGGAEKRDRWMVCADGPSVDACAQGALHPRARPGARSARSRSGEPADAYPGDAAVEGPPRTSAPTYVGGVAGLPRRVRLRLHLVPRTPSGTRGNRRSVCWARTTQ